MARGRTAPPARLVRETLAPVILISGGGLICRHLQHAPGHWEHIATLLGLRRPWRPAKSVHRPVAEALPAVSPYRGDVGCELEKVGTGTVLSLLILVI